LIFRAEAWGDKVRLVTWLAERMEQRPDDLVGHMPFEVLAVVKNAAIQGVVLYINYRGASIEMSCAGDTGWLTRGAVKAFLSYPFVQLKCRRVTSIVHRKNKKSRDLAERLGFRLEGVCKHWFDTGDGIVYGLTRAECKWIEQDHGYIQQKRSQSPQRGRNYGRSGEGQRANGSGEPAVPN
jgi:RimJ/RimL family protein N-acetyltransferase